MSTKILDGIILREMLLSGHANLENEKEKINALNVFPVPDGDTGVNLSKTLEGGVTANEDKSVGVYMKSFSKKSLLTARGNSGVILSQFIRGFAKGCEGKDTITTEDFALAFKKGVECAYSAVIKPVEGTMLTVLREAGEYLMANASLFADFEECLSSLCKKAGESLKRTPDLLPILREAGVVDSGGAGVLAILLGMESFLSGKAITLDATVAPAKDTDISYTPNPDFVFDYGYCTEFILQLLNAKCDPSSFDMTSLVAFLESVGNSVVAVQDSDIVKVHVHTMTPEKVIAKAREYGELVTVKIENMSVQHSETAERKEHTKYAIVAVASGSGIKKYFCEIGVNAIIDGGQTSNPSAEDFIKTFKELNADHIIVLPNNSNIILTARQAAKLYKGSDVQVIPTKSIAECYSALSMMDLTPDTVEGVIESMMQYLPYVTTGYVTTATRDAVLNGVSVEEGKFIGLDNDNILSCEENKVDAAMGLFRRIPDIEDKAVITVFYGADVTDEELSDLKSRLSKELPLVETGYVDGGQDIYSFIFSIE